MRGAARALRARSDLANKALAGFINRP